MICPNCGTEIGQNPACPNCGAPVNQNAGGGSPVVQQRSIALCIVLSIVTCGIYGLYWLYCLNEDTKVLVGDVNGTSGGMVILLSIVTCGIYMYYWMYKQGEKIDAAKIARNIPASNSGILYLILSIFQLGIVSYAIMQSEINKMV